MKLTSITIKNYRSIEELSFDIATLDDGTFTYGLIGVNEAGKSTILKALALKDGLKNEKGEAQPLARDFKYKAKPVEIEYTYSLDRKEQQEAKDYLVANAPSADITGIDLSGIIYTVYFDLATPTQAMESVYVKSIKDDNEHKVAVEEHLTTHISPRTHESIFWTAEDRYLISQPINLAQFATTPDDISIPLKNCFALAGIAGIDAIKSRIALITESTEREQLENELGEKVTAHINTAWPKHPIKITFDISDGLINFHVHDLYTKGKAKTADQRSDGFRQFVSFLLTISAQNSNDELSNSILLLDEPETHLHPQAQEDLLRELVKITQNKRNNLVFFATHSNYMIDKKDLSRNYKVFKKPNKKTEKEKTELMRFGEKVSTYASVTYDVFEISSTDYHNELYDRLRADYGDENSKDAVGITEFDNGYFIQVKKLPKTFPLKKEKNKITLPTYIRNCIHYPKNQDKDFNKQLTESIELLRTYIK
jgi:predicted ATP-dependent endonuclease of OLD family